MSLHWWYLPHFDSCKCFQTVDSHKQPPNTQKCTHISRKNSSRERALKLNTIPVYMTFKNKAILNHRSLFRICLNQLILIYKQNDNIYLREFTHKQHQIIYDYEMCLHFGPASITNNPVPLWYQHSWIIILFLSILFIHILVIIAISLEIIGTEM